MKIQEVLKLAEPDWPEDARSVAADRTRTMLAPVRAPNRIARLGSSDIFPDADPNPNHGETDDLSLAPDPSPTSSVTISPAHRRDLDFIKFQLARLPRHTEQ
jgi:hypothetical protein